MINHAILLLELVVCFHSYRAKKYQVLTISADINTRETV